MFKYLKQKKIFEEIANKIIKKMQNLNKKIDSNNLNHYYKGESAPKSVIGFKGPPGFRKNIKESYITLEKAKEKQKVFKSDLNEKLKGKYKSKN